MGGEYNVSNLMQQYPYLKNANVSNENIVQSINSFYGIERRFETHISNNEIVFIDDYAIIQRRLKKVSWIRDMYSDREITVIFNLIYIVEPMILWMILNRHFLYQTN